MDSEPSSPANDVSCCVCGQSGLLHEQMVSLMSFAVSTLVPSEEMDSEGLLAGIGMALNTETFLNSCFSAKLALQEHKATRLQITELEEP